MNYNAIMRNMLLFWALAVYLVMFCFLLGMAIAKMHWGEALFLFVLNTVNWLICYGLHEETKHLKESEKKNEKTDTRP